MIDFIREIFEYRFLGNAVLACVLSGIACGIIGTYIVSRRLVFLSGGITHASFGGVGISYYLGMNPVWGAFVFALLSAMSLDGISQRMRIREDSAIGILWSIGMAIGIIFIAITPGYAPNLMSFLFGNILNVTRADLWLTIGVDAVLVVGMLFFYRPVIYISFDREYARSQNMPVNTVNAIMMVLVAATIVASIRLVGIVLLISLLTIPPVIVNSLTASFKKIMGYSVLISTLGTFMGLYVSYRTNIPSGASTILVLSFALIIMKTIAYFK